MSSMEGFATLHDLNRGCTVGARVVPSTDVIRAPASDWTGDGAR